MNLSPHFVLAEFTTSQAAARKGFLNIPTQKEVDCLRNLCVQILEPLRVRVGTIVISSGYRAPLVNKAVGGASSSQHVLGQAADIIVPGMTPMEVVQRIRSMRLPFDQVIEEFGSWTHVSYGPRHRRQALLARRVGGKATYTPI